MPRLFIKPLQYCDDISQTKGGKEVEEMPQFKGTLAALDNLGKQSQTKGGKDTKLTDSKVGKEDNGTPTKT